VEISNGFGQLSVTAGRRKWVMNTPACAIGTMSEEVRTTDESVCVAAKRLPVRDGCLF
jgi:hypothetical protein